jgi:hypothetical protein
MEQERRQGREHFDPQEAVALPAVVQMRSWQAVQQAALPFCSRS